MFHPESNPLAPKSTGPKKPEKELVRVWLGDEAAAEMDEREPETGDEEDLNPKKHELTEKEKKALKRPDEATLRNIPKWEELPDEETFKRDFKFQSIWEEEYRKGRPLSDFNPHPKETLPSFQGIKTLPYAKVFDITNAIARAKEKDPEHPDSLATAEVLKLIDEAGYRPATLEELVAYARDYWKPDADPKTLTREELSLQNAQAWFIIGLDSICSDAYRRRNASILTWDGDERRLTASALERDWNAGNRFLVLRKASP